MTLRRVLLRGATILAVAGALLSLAPSYLPISPLPIHGAAFADPGNGNGNGGGNGHGHGGGNGNGGGNGGGNGNGNGGGNGNGNGNGKPDDDTGDVVDTAETGQTAPSG